MSANPAQTPVLAQVTYLEKVRDDRSQEESSTEQLHRELDTERIANKALLAGVLDLDAKLATERSAGQAMLSTICELDRRLGAERETIARWEAWADEAERVLAENARGEQSGSWWSRLRGR